MDFQKSIIANTTAINNKFKTINVGTTATVELDLADAITTAVGSGWCAFCIYNATAGTITLYETSGNDAAGQIYASLDTTPIYAYAEGPSDGFYCYPAATLPTGLHIQVFFP